MHWGSDRTQNSLKVTIEHCHNPEMSASNSPGMIRFSTDRTKIAFLLLASASTMMIHALPLRFVYILLAISAALADVEITTEQSCQAQEIGDVSWC